MNQVFHNTLCADAIRAKLSPTSLWPDNIHCFETIDSTNTRAKVMAAQGAPHGTVLIADSQSGGRGRLGRSFLSPAGVGIYLSVILRPECPPAQLMHLTCAAAVAACDAVKQSTGLCPGIKWTNDLVVGKRKLAGILTELSVDPKNGMVQYAIVGIGINCCQREEDFPPEIRATATSLSIACEKPVDRNGLAAVLIDSFEAMASGLHDKKEQIMDSYRKNCITVGQEISLLRGDEVRHGKALDITMDGSLLVSFPDGHAEEISSGEVSVRGMYGYI